MNSNTPLARAVKFALRGAAVVSAVLAVPPAFAQEGAALEEVVVTGSRIRQNPLEERLPVR